MQVLRNLYLTDRVFYVLGGCSFLLFLAYAFEPVFPFALALLGMMIVLLLADLLLLFSGAQVSARRTGSAILSLHESNKVYIDLNNVRNRFLRIKVIDEIPYQFNQRDFKVELSLASKGHTKLEYEVKPVIRGEYHFGNINLFVRTRIGLVAKRETTPAEKLVAVYPSIIQMGRQELAAMNHPAFTQGESKNRKLGQSYEFDQIKAYVPGDDTRNINWKASSALNEMMVNCYEDERSQQIYSILDKSRVMKMPFNGLTLLDYAVNATLAFSNIVLKKQDKAGLIIFSKNAGTVVKADRGPRHLKKLMYSLYKEKYDYSEASYEALYATVKRNIPNRSLLFLYTNFDSIYALERNLPALRLLNKNHLLVVVFFDNQELESYSNSEAESLLDIYQLTIAKKFILEKNQIYKELQKHGIQCIKCNPESLSTATINRYLDLKSRGMI